MDRTQAAAALRALADHREEADYDDEKIANKAAKALAAYATPCGEADPKPTKDHAEANLDESEPETIREIADDIEAGREVLIETAFED